MRHSAVQVGLSPLLGLLLFLSLTSRAEPPSEAVPAPEWDAQFQRTNGWVGADGAYSIPLSQEVTLWLFGDTLVGEVREGKRVNVRMINNSIALQRGTNRPEFFHRTTRDGQPESFFKPGHGKSYFWPFHGTRTSGGLYLILHRIETVKTGNPFGFKFLDAWLGHVANPDDPPSQWRITQKKIPFTTVTSKGALIFGGAVMCDGDFVYIGGGDSRPQTKQAFLRNGMVLARVPAEQIGDFKQWRFFANGKWQTDFKRVTPVFPGVASEFSLSYQAAIKKYVAVYMEGGIFGTILVRLASAPEGPWSEPRRVYRCPEQDGPLRNFCYAAKAHPELPAAADELLVTYAVNSWDFWNLFKEASLYWPRFVRVKLSAASAE